MIRDALSSLIETFSSGFLSPYGPPVRSKRPGPLQPSFPSADALRKLGSLQVIDRALFVYVKISATTLGALKVHSTPRHLKFLSCSRNSTLKQATRVKPWAYTRRSYG